MRRKRTIIASTLIIVGLLIAVGAEALISGRFNPQLETIPTKETQQKAEEDKVIIIEREAPTLSPETAVSSEPSAPPSSQSDSQTKTSESSHQIGNGTRGIHQMQPSHTAQQNQPTPAEPTVPTETAPAYERPTVIESTPPEPAPVPEPEPSITSISLDSSSMSLLTGDNWRLSILSAPSSVTSQGAKWVTSNSSVIDLVSPDLSGVTVQGKSPGTATVSIYSRDGLYSAACTVTVT